MEYKDARNLVVHLPKDHETTVFQEGNEAISLLRPSVVSKRFKSYDPNKNFQIWLAHGRRRFRPNHLRVLIDLNLRVRSRPDLRKQLLAAFDEIFYRGNPETALRDLASETFGHFLDPLVVTGVLHQFFLIEQEYGYHQASRYDPPTLFLQGWVRQFIDGPREIDNLCMSVASDQPPAVRYTSQDDKNHKAYNPQRKALWYAAE